MFPALDPIKLRQTKAREVFILFKRADVLYAQLKEEKENKETKPSRKEEQMIDVTGIDTGWY